MPSSSLPHVAVIGAGIAGLSCATALQRRGLRVTVFEKSRGPAGRMSTRRGAEGDQQGWQCDHGAQYFTARDAAFRAEVQRWVEAGVAALWTPRLQVLGDASLHRSDAGIARYVGLPQMTAPARWLAQGLTLRAETTITQLQRAGDAWQLLSAEQGLLGERFAAVLLAVPAPQAAPLLLPVAPALAGVAASVRMRACWALMLRFETAVKLSFDAAFVNGGPLRWIARNNSKPGRSGAETWLLHAEAEWSEAHVTQAPEAVAALLLQAFTALGGPPPQAWTVHRWRYADTAPDTTPPPAAGCSWQAELGLGLCGDWLGGGKVEGAWLSGQQLGLQAQPRLLKDQGVTAPTAASASIRPKPSSGE